MKNYRLNSDGQKVWNFGAYTLPLSQEFIDKEFEPQELIEHLFKEKGQPFEGLPDAWKCSHNKKKMRMQCSICESLDAALGM